jgi:hypothetical protein
MIERKIEINVNELGTGTLIVDGEDWSNSVLGFNIIGRAGKPLEVTFTLTPRAVQINGIGDLKIEVPQLSEELSRDIMKKFRDISEKGAG